MIAAEAILLSVQIWAGLGGLVAVAFLLWGIDRIDEDADGAYVFRPLLVPGILLIWPLVLWRWAVLARDGDVWRKRYDPPRRQHQAVSVLLPVAIVVVIVTGIAQRQVWPSEVAPMQLSAPEASP